MNIPTVTLRELITLEDQGFARAVFDEVWPIDSGGTEITPNLLQAMVHNGVYLSGAFVDGKIAGAAFAFPSIQGELHLHSHMTAILPQFRDLGIGSQLKAHQWNWAKTHSFKSITWTFDPLVRRNAKLNILKLGADVASYEPNFYGAMPDALNVGDESDRIVIRWDLSGEKPAPRRALSAFPSASIRIEIPEDIVELRGIDMAEAMLWRHRVRDQFLAALKSGKKVIGFSINNEYILH